MSAEEIATFRNMQPTTVYSHIAHLIQIDLFNDWQSFVKKSEVDKVKFELEKRNGSTELKPIYEGLNG
ncbi:MAG: helix-turn-helix domain-containing protein, partial [Bacteroidales bacterium]